MVAQLFVKIDDVSVGIALTQNGDEAKNIPLQSKTFAVGFGQGFSRQLGRTIQ